MKKGGSDFAKIKLNTETGEIEKIKDENEKDAVEVSAEEAERVQQSPNAKLVARVLHIHQSPGCIYVVKSNGSVVKICR